VGHEDSGRGDCRSVLCDNGLREKIKQLNFRNSHSDAGRRLRLLLPLRTRQTAKSLATWTGRMKDKQSPVPQCPSRALSQRPAPPAADPALQNPAVRNFFKNSPHARSPTPLQPAVFTFSRKSCVAARSASSSPLAKTPSPANSEKPHARIKIQRKPALLPPPPLQQLLNQERFT